MRRNTPRLLPTVDVAEPRLLLSATAPLSSASPLARVVHEVKAIVNNLAKTDDMVQASANLSSLASQIAPSSNQLAAWWQHDVALYRRGSPRSVIATQQRIVSDLRHFLQATARGTSQPVTGTGSTTAGAPTQGTTTTPTPTPTGTSTSSPATTPSLDSVRIENETGLSLTVTVYLDDSQNPEPYITETIPAQGNPTVLFNFGTSTGAFMTMNISRSDNLQSPAPFDNVQLSQPLGGYDGTLFTISLLGPYFNVGF
jgi:hypothetical protein